MQKKKHKKKKKNTKKQKQKNENNRIYLSIKQVEPNETEDNGDEALKPVDQQQRKQTIQ